MRRFLPVIIYFIILAAFIVAIVQAFSSNDKAKDTSPPPPATQQPPSGASKSAPAKPAPAGSQSSDMADVGPGNVVALYVVSTAAGTLAFSVYRRHKLGMLE